MKTPNTPLQTPNTKHQTPKKLQISSSNMTVSLRRLGFGAWSFFGVWRVVFGVWRVAVFAFALGVGMDATLFGLVNAQSSAQAGVGCPPFSIREEDKTAWL